MLTESIQVSGVIPASPDRIYEAWLDSTEHSGMTGGRATVDPMVGGQFTAWGGTIRGTTIELEPGRRIVQLWRSEEFPPESPDSRLEVLLEPSESGTRVTFLHSDIPEGLSSQYEDGWRKYYLDPMSDYFGQPEPSSVVSGSAVELSFESPDLPIAKPAAKPASNPRPKAKPAAKKAKKAAARTGKSAKKKPAAKKARPRKATGGKSKARKGKAKRGSARRSSRKSARRGKR
jgi:uncharacterized protein YndB with AHSA1/START domain